MKNKKSFADGEANEWFKRNIAIIEDNRDDAHISLLIDWLEPFKNEKLKNLATNTFGF